MGLTGDINGTHHDAQSFEDVEFTHGTGAVLVQPGVHTHFMEDMSAERQRHVYQLPIKLSDGTGSWT